MTCPHCQQVVDTHQVERPDLRDAFFDPAPKLMVADVHNDKYGRRCVGSGRAVIP